ncbi:ATP synthase F(0) complex subunit k, mitochondrial-like [Oculina patagonica]
MSGVLWRSLRVPLSRRMTRQMADHPTAEELGLTGWQYYFNTQTIAGRRNVVFAVYGSLFGVIGLYKLRSKPKKEAAAQ